VYLDVFQYFVLPLLWWNHTQEDMRNI